MADLNDIEDSDEELEDLENGCPLGICDGSGVVEIGEFDDIEESECACRK